MSLAEQRGRQPGHVVRLPPPPPPPPADVIPQVSTGRGGAGNLVAHPVPDDDSLPGAERGRELSPHPGASDHVRCVSTAKQHAH